MTSQDAAEPDQNIQLLELTQDDIDEMLKVMYVSRKTLEKRFFRKDRCFAVLDEGKVVSFMWILFNKRCVSGLHLKFNLGLNQGWFYNAVTIKQARKRGYFTNIFRHMAKVLGVEGFDELLMDVDHRNQASIRGLEKAGSKKIAKVKIKKIFSKRKYYLHIFDEEAWRRLSETIEDFDKIRLQYVTGHNR